VLLLCTPCFRLVLGPSQTKQTITSSTSWVMCRTPKSHEEETTDNNYPKLKDRVSLNIRTKENNRQVAFPIVSMTLCSTQNLSHADFFLLIPFHNKLKLQNQTWATGVNNEHLVLKLWEPRADNKCCTDCWENFRVVTFWCGPEDDDVHGLWACGEGEGDQRH